MKGIYQGNKFDVEGPSCKKKKKKIRAIITGTAQKIFGANRGPNGNAQTTLHYDRTWFPRGTHGMDILGSDGNHISDLLSPSALPSTSCTDDYERDNSILNTTSQTWLSNRNTINLHCPALTWQ